MIAGRFAVPALIRAQRLAPLRYEDCPPLLAYQQTKQHIPTMGGLFVLGVAMAVAALAGGMMAREGWLMLLGTLGMAVVGFADDAMKYARPNGLGFRSAPKLLISLGLGAVIGLLTRSFSWGWILFAMVVIAGSAHAVNLTDGMDGLAAGCGAMAFATLGLAELMQAAPNHVFVTWCASLAGACVGFLWFNAFPASVFLGDVGAMGLGAALGVLGVLSRHPLWLAVVGGVFVIEALSVMLQVASYKWRNKKRMFRVAPIHHHFHLGGLPEPKVIVRFWIAGALFAVFGLAWAAHP